jgi:hypothetical protein
MIHIVFQEADIAVLQKAIDLDETLNGSIIQIKDDYAVGPLGDLSTPEGWQARRDWWKEALQFSPYLDSLDMVDDKMTLHRLLETLDAEPQQEAWIWMAQNQHDVCGYYWLVSHLKEYQGRIQVLYLNNLPFLNEKGGVFYPVNLYEIQPSEFRKAKRLARPITLSEFEIDPDEWFRLSSEDAGVRLLEGGKKIVGKGYDYYDKDLLPNITANWQKFSRVLNNTINRMKIKTGDVFIAWRLRELIASGLVELNGDLTKGWTSAEVKLKGAVPAGMAPGEAPAGADEASAGTDEASAGTNA